MMSDFIYVANLCEMNLTDFGDPLTFHQAPLSGQNVVIFPKLELMTPTVISPAPEV